MNRAMESLFSPLALKNITVPNRIVRSATFEGCGDSEGNPMPALGEIYRRLAEGGVGTIITGFAFISERGRAMQPGQCGIDEDAKIWPWREIVKRVREANPETKLLMQIAHAGRQTLKDATGMDPVGPSSRKCTYFRQPVRPLDDRGVGEVVDEFAAAALRAREAGFDGVQIHAAHGYLIHQFLSGWTNTRTDRWGEKHLFLTGIIRAIRKRCGERFPVLVKLSGADDNTGGLRIEDTVKVATELKIMEVDALEVSYGTMEYAMNIFRGALPVDTVLEVNPLFNKYPKLLRRAWKRFFLPRRERSFHLFQENYNVPNAVRIKEATGLPVIPVGGIRSLEGMLDIVGENGLDGAALCRPLIAEPGLPESIRRGTWTRSKCVNCNMCAVHCDSGQITRCHTIREVIDERSGR